MKGPCMRVVTSPLLWLDNYPADSLFYLLDLLCCERCKDQAVWEVISGIQVIIILIFIKKTFQDSSDNYGTSQCKTNLHNQDRYHNALWTQLTGNRNVCKLLPTTLKIVAFASDMLGEDVHCCISLQGVGPETQWALHSPRWRRARGQPQPAWPVEVVQPEHINQEFSKPIHYHNQ